MRWKYDQEHTTLQGRKGLKTVSSLCTTDVQLVKWIMDQLWCHMSHKIVEDFDGKSYNNNG